MKMPLVSIILPTYNGARYLEDSIHSCLAQSYLNLELIIVNDCSCDNTEEIIRTFQDDRIHYVKNEENKKLPASLNVGFSAAKGDFLTWTSDDNEYKPNAVLTMVNYLLSHDDTDFVYGNQDLIDEHGGLIAEKIMRSPDSIPIESCCGGYFMFTRRLYDQVGGYDENWFVVEDWEFVLRAYNSGFQFDKIEENHYRYRIHSRSLSATKEQAQLEGCYRLCRENLRRNIKNYPRDIVVRIYLKLIRYCYYMNDKLQGFHMLKCAQEIDPNALDRLHPELVQWFS